MHLEMYIEMESLNDVENEMALDNDRHKWQLKNNTSPTVEVLIK